MYIRNRVYSLSCSFLLSFLSRIISSHTAYNHCAIKTTSSDQMKCCFILCMVWYISVANGKQRNLIHSHQINQNLLEKLYSEKIWTKYIDKLLSNIPSDYTMASIYKNITVTVSFARHWCSIPQSYVGVFKDVSVSTMIDRHNVSNLAPCGVIIHQYHQDANMVPLTTYVIKVNIQFHVNVSVIESYLENLKMDWEARTYNPLRYRKNGKSKTNITTVLFSI